MKTLLLLLTLVSLTGCAGTFWSDELKRKATDYAVGQTYELIQDIGVSKTRYAKRMERLTNSDSIVPRGTRLKITKLKYEDSLENGRYIDDEAVIITGEMTGTKIKIRNLSKPGWPDRRFRELMFVDNRVMKRVD